MSEGSSARKLLVDVRAIASAFTVTGEALAELAAEEAQGWRVHVAESETISDGDSSSRTSTEVLCEIADAEVYFGFGIPRELFLAAPRLKWVHSASAGVGAVLFEEMRSSDVLLTNSAGIYGPPIAEHVLAGILHFLRDLDVAVAGQMAHRWEKPVTTGAGSTVRSLSGRRVLIVGTGGIGSEIASRLTALGARCSGIRRRPELGTPKGFERVTGVGQLDEELAVADIVVLAAPATRETTAILNEGRIALLRRGAIVVNVARGTLVDEGALIAALREGRIRGAFLDVVQNEPLPPDDPLWSQRGVFITPHVSGVSPEWFWQREMTLFLDNWRRYRAGMPLHNLVDKKAGY